MLESFEIDLDTESVWFDGTWLGREELVGRIKAMIDAGDFQIARPSQALESLTNALSQARLLALRITPEMSEALNALAQQTGRPVGSLAREALTSYLANAGTQPQPLPLQLVTEAAPAPTIQAALSTEPASAEEAASALVLTPKRRDTPSDGSQGWYTGK